MKTLSQLAQLAGTSEDVLSCLAQSSLSKHLDYDMFSGKRGEVTEDYIRLVLASAFIRLGMMMPPHQFPVFRLLQHARLRYISICVEHTPNKSYVVPALNGDAFAHLKCEFTTILLEDLMIRSPSFNREAQIIKLAVAKTKTTQEAVAILLEHGTLFVGSVGCRSTNSGTDIHIIFNDVPTALAHQILEKIVDIKNEQNTGREYGFYLTHLSEVAQFFCSLGLRPKLYEFVDQVKKFEETNSLKDIHSMNDGRIPDYKNNSMVLRIPLIELFAS